MQAALAKQTSSTSKTPEQIDAAIGQLVSKAITTEGQVIDVFTAAGLPKLDISILRASKRGESLGLNDDEIAFYDALAANDSAVQAMGDDKLKLIAAELITPVKKSVSIDWTLRESARARIRVMVKRILSKHGYPPDLQEEAVKTVLAQAELLCNQWV